MYTITVRSTVSLKFCGGISNAMPKGKSTIKVKNTLNSFTADRKQPKKRSKK